MKTDSTEACRLKAVELYPGTFPGDWKRTWKTKTEDGSVRHFFNKKTSKSVVVVCNGQGELSAYPCDEEAGAGPAMFSTDAKALKEACRGIKHCGDYCHLWWNPNTRVAHLTMGDGDGDPDNGGTSFDDIEDWLIEAGARSVIFADEYSPDEEEGFILLGTDLGKVIEWEEA